MVDPREPDFDYVGDSAWGEYAECFLADWDDCPFQRDLLAAVGGDRNVAIVMWRHFQGQALDALNKPWPVLGDRTPNDCMHSDLGVKRLRQALIEFPYP